MFSVKTNTKLSYANLKAKNDALEELLFSVKDYLINVPEHVALDLRNAVAKVECKIRSL